MNASIMQQLLTMLDQFRIYHWTTTSYAEHQAFGGLYEAFSDLTDKFMECFMGKYGRPSPDSNQLKLTLSFSDKSECLEKCCEFLRVTMTNMLDGGRDTDLLNIRDEMLAEISKTKYLLSLS